MSKTRWKNGVISAMLFLGVAAAGCRGSYDERAKSAADSEPNRTADAKPNRIAGVDDTIARFKQKGASIERLFSESAGYVVIPTVGEGAFIVGGGHGQGEAFERGTYVGRVTVNELSIGAQVGGQSYSQVIFFETPVDFERLKKNSFQFGGEVLAIAADESAAKNATYKDGVATFILPKKGLMASASVSGQKLDFRPAR